VDYEVFVSNGFSQVGENHNISIDSGRIILQAKRLLPDIRHR
jgi:hypothetical protein